MNASRCLYVCGATVTVTHGTQAAFVHQLLSLLLPWNVTLFSDEFIYPLANRTNQNVTWHLPICHYYKKFIAVANAPRRQCCNSDSDSEWKYAVTDFGLVPQKAEEKCCGVKWFNPKHNLLQLNICIRILYVGTSTDNTMPRTNQWYFSFSFCDVFFQLLICWSTRCESLCNSLYSEKGKKWILNSIDSNCFFFSLYLSHELPLARFG